jgi:putative transposase
VDALHDVTRRPGCGVTGTEHHLVRDLVAPEGPKHGCGHLLVDGCDETLARKATFAFSPGRRQERLLLELLAVCCETYNAGLEERRAAFRHPSRSKVTVFDQFNQLAWLRHHRPDVFAFGLQPIRGTLRRLDEAYGAFLRRCANGETPGFPRFRSRARFDTVYWAEPTSWKVELGPDSDPNGATLYLQGVGTIRLPKRAVRQCRRFFDRGGRAATLTVTRHRAGKGWAWRATVAFTGVRAAKLDRPGDLVRLTGIDRGVKVAAATSNGGLLTMPSVWVAARDEIAELQRERAAKKKYSRSWRALNRRIARLYSRASRVADNWAREAAREIVDGSDVVVLEDLKLANMTRSAKGTVEEPGTNVAAKAALNRKMSEAALGRLRYRICTRAEEAGCRIWVVPAHHTSQTCPSCGQAAKENRATQARFECVSCGHADHADINAAVNIAARGATAEAAWRAAGSPSLVRPKARLQRRKKPTAAPLAA